MTDFHVKYALAGQSVPSFQALRCFEVAARLGSFKAAAEKLHLTPSAISHRIADLERLLGVTLFERKGKSVQLTPTGAALYPKLQNALDQLMSVLDDVGNRQDAMTVRVAVAPLFFARFLSTRLAEFNALHPDITVNLHSAAENEVIGLYDCAIRFGFGAWPDCVSRKLFDVSVVAVCSPHLLEANNQSSSAASTFGLPLVESSSSPESWPHWCAASGLDHNPKYTTVVAGMEDALLAALRGLGVCLTIREFIVPELQFGLLATAFPTGKPALSAYWLAQPKRRTASAASKTFMRWVLKQQA